MSRQVVFVVTELMCNESLKVVVFADKKSAEAYREAKAASWHNIDKDTYMRELSDIEPDASEKEFYETEIYEIKIHKREVL